MTIAAFLDANVLYSATLRSVMMELALAGVFRPLWSERVHDEWTNALGRDRPDIPLERIARTRALMLAHVEDAMVAGYEPLLGALSLPDPDDCHVLAAAIHGEAEIIVTANIKDFPASALIPHNLTAITPDTFVVRLISEDPGGVIAAFKTQRASLKHPPINIADYLTTLERAGLDDTVAILRTLDANI